MIRLRLGAGRPGAPSCGYTLIELIMVMVIVGILAALGGIFIVEPFRASADMTRRAALVDQADLALDHISREMRTALPNSVRVAADGEFTSVEFLLTRAGGRYRRLPPGDTLNRARANDTFEVLGGLAGIGDVRAVAGTDCADGVHDCISIYNTGQPGFNAYAGDNLATVVDRDDTGPHVLEYQAAGSGPAFAAHSPAQRFYVVETVVSYVCNTNTGTLLRYTDYGLHDPQPLPNDGSGTLVPGTGARVARRVAACSFTYASGLGASTRRGLLKMELSLTDGGETVTLFAQAHVENSP